MAAIFVAMLAATVVTNALPVIIQELHGSQTGYSWVIIAEMLAMAATTPIWGKLADLYSKKLLVQVALSIFVVATAVAGLSQSMTMLIGARVFTGVAAGGVIALTQIIIASIVPPRERGRYTGYIGAAFASATIIGPLVGGVIVDSPIGWRGVFYVSIPVALAAIYLLQKNIHLVELKRKPSIDYWGALFIMAGVSLFLLWVSFGGHQFAWLSATSLGLLAAGLGSLAAAVFVEAKVADEPIIPFTLFKERTVVLSTIATVFVGMSMFGSTVYLSEYFQYAKGMSATNAGMMSIFMVVGMMGTAIITGRLITKYGRWKRYLTAGSILLPLALFLQSFITADTSLVQTAIFMAIMGAGIGMLNQNLVLAVQNEVPREILGSATSLVSFMRSMGGSIGLAVFGAILNSRSQDGIASGAKELLASGKIKASDLEQLSHGDVPALDKLSPPLRTLFEQSFGNAVGMVFLLAAIGALFVTLAIAFIRESQLATSFATPGEELEAAAGSELSQPTISEEITLVPDNIIDDNKVKELEPQYG